MKHDWRRYLCTNCGAVRGTNEISCGGCIEWETEEAETTDLTPPPGGGWVMASSFGVGRAPGPGSAPGRVSRSRPHFS